jgi:UDP-N-acetylmuramoyl-tripeptide--D-alanyl-D-alanine ligase
MNLKLDEISKAVQGTLDGPGNLTARGYSIDTRTLNPGDLFFAVKGPHFDGHSFVKDAMERKAAGAVIEAGDATSSPSFGVIRVGSTVEALQHLAQTVRRLWAKPVIGVTGSVGKTTTKEMIASVLARRFTVLRSIGNLNNEFGLPLCLLRVESRQTIGVLEMGMSAKGEIRKLASIAEPNEGVITNVNAVHLEFFDSIEGIAEAKAELLDGLVEPKRAYLNYDDHRVRAMASRVPGKVVTYGLDSAADFSADCVRDLGLRGSAFKVRHSGAVREFRLPLLGQHNIGNALAAITVAACHGVPWEDIQSAIADMKPEKMRGQVVRFREGFVVIDDSYNSNPKALTEMIHFVGRLQGQSRKILVVGEMLELGKDAADLHRACGREAALSGAALIVGVQGMAREILEGARQAGAESGRLAFAEDSVQAGQLLADAVKEGDVVLIKGSRRVKLEQALSSLRAAFSSVEA